jgi:hypothetical protein
MAGTPAKAVNVNFFNEVKFIPQYNGLCPNYLIVCKKLQYRKAFGRDAYLRLPHAIYAGIGAHFVKLLVLRETQLCVSTKKASLLRNNAFYFYEFSVE